MRVVLLVFTLLASQSFALTEPEELTRLLTKWDPQSLQRVRPVEELNARTKSDEVALRTALILAYAPESILKTKPHFYAEFVLKHRKELKVQDLFSLYRIAGDGYYENLNFKKAISFYEEALENPQIESKDREYFVYKNAWAHLNLQQPSKAYNILKMWLKENAATLLRNPMMVDLGRSLGEATFDKSKPLSIPDHYRPQTDLEAQQIMEGLLKAFQRTPEKTDNFYKLAFSQEWSSKVLPQIIESPVIQKKGPCEIMNMKTFINSELLRDPRLLPTLDNCAVNILKSTSKNKTAMEQVADWMQTFSLSPLQQWTVVRLWAGAQKYPLACDKALEMTTTLSANVPEWTPDWWDDTAQACHKALTNPNLQSRILERADAWVSLKLKPNLIEDPQLTAATKKSLLQKWKSTENSEDEKLVLYVVSATDSDVRKASLQELCPFEKPHCWPLWERQVIESPDFLRQLVDTQDTSVVGSGKLPELMTFVQATKEFLNTTELTIATKSPIVPSALKASPLKTDLTFLADLQGYREDTLSPKTLSETEALQAMLDFQSQAAHAGKRSWFSARARDRAKKEMSHVASYLKNQTALLGSTPEEKLQWKQVGNTLNKWIVR